MTRTTLIKQHLRATLAAMDHARQLLTTARDNAQDDDAEQLALAGQDLDSAILGVDQVYGSTDWIETD